MVFKRVVKDRVSQMKKQKEKNLEERRKRLAAKLRQEEAMYQKEFNDNLETPEQVRQQMAKKLFLLKKQRQEEKKQIVEQAEERQREQQLRDKKRKRDQEIFEEMLFAKMSEVDMKKKIEREKREAKEKQERVKETMDIISWQNKTKSETQNIEKMKEEAEKQKFNEIWKLENKKEEEMERQRNLINKERNLELIRHNQMEKEIKNLEEEKEKERDKFLLQQALDRERAMEELEKQEKEERRQEAKELQNHYKQQSDDAKKKDNGKFRKTNGEKKMKQEFSYSEKYTKKMFRNEDKNNIIREKDELDRALDEQNREHETKVLSQKMNKNQHQSDILKQIGVKERERRKEYRDTMFEQRAMKLSELGYNKKVDHENAKNQQMLETLRSQRPY
ncbi:unnamed protein product [Moneuplotes crassus]|uniref:Trichohyalin-plectin-homology domain-containing protein n=1 Tax=Euplotes crassus TaxID=5936 RepID=A0AAD1UEI7_EUPCR|nr:unnamed protein product [Moneuplotes crassus]